MKNIRTPRVVASCITALLFLSASSAIADINIGSNIVWTDAYEGATIEVLAPHDDLDIQAIIDAITDASENKPYIIKLGAGVYLIDDSSISMKEWVSIQGSGIASTELVGWLSGSEQTTSAIVLTANNVSLTDLTITNTGFNNGAISVGILNANTSPLIQRVIVDVSGGINNIGIANGDSSSPDMKDIKVAVEGGEEAIGIANVDGSTPNMTDISVAVADATYNIGISNDKSAPTVMKDIAVIVSGGDGTTGILNKEVAWGIAMEDVTILASGGASLNTGMLVASSKVSMKDSIILLLGGTESVGVAIGNVDSAPPASETFIQESTIVGEDGATALLIYEESLETRIVNNLIEGDVVNLLPAMVKPKEICRGNYDTDLNDVTCSRWSLEVVQSNNKSKDLEIKSLKAENEELSERMTMLENMVNKLTAKEVVMNQ